MKKPIHISADSNDPRGAAHPIGYKVSGHHLLKKYVPGILTNNTEIRLCKKDILDFSHPQKYPLKQKCIAANNVSKQYALKY